MNKKYRFLSMDNQNTSFVFMKEKLLQFFKNEDMKRHMKEMIQPIGTIIYNELFIYIWLICIYNVVLFFVIILVLVLLLTKRNIRQTI
jgi:hypothetical protein